MNQKKKDILIIKTGGTIAQKPNEKGVLVPCDGDYLQKVDGLENIANIDVSDLGNIDSTSMDMPQRMNIVREIHTKAKNYDGFVIVHGTDTMAETAATLTYALPKFGKPIIITGSQRSIWTARSDGPNNLFTAIQAATKDYGEVAVAFGNYILRGTRVKKVDEEGYDAFMTPGLEPIGKVYTLEDGIKEAEHRIKISTKSLDRDWEPIINENYNDKIFHYSHISGAQINDTLIDIANRENIEGIIMSGFGAGNIPDSLIPFIKEATNNGKPVVVYTKCDKGAADMSIYAVGDAALEAGAVSAGDMTFEALGQKMMFVLPEILGTNDIPRYTNLMLKMQYNFDITVTQDRK